MLSEQLAYLTVKGPAEADIYINGMRKGPTNQPVVVPCGRWFLRLAPPNPGRFPAWLGKGETVLIPCRQATVLTVNVDDGSYGGPRPGTITAPTVSSRRASITHDEERSSGGDSPLERA